MTVQDLPRRVVIAGSGTTGPFSFAFQVLSTSEVKVTVFRANGNIDSLMLDIDFSVALAAAPGTGGDVTTTLAIPVGDTVVIEGDTPFVQPDPIAPNDRLPAATIETALDRMTFLAQQNRALADRTLVLPADTAVGTQATIEAPVAGQFVRGNSGGTGFENADIIPLGSLGLPVSLADGGSGATTAAGARAAFLAAGTGDANVFTENQTIQRGDTSEAVLELASLLAAAGSLARIDFEGRDDAAGTDIYGRIRTAILDATASSEDSELLLAVQIASTLTDVMRIGNGVQVGSPTGGYQGAGTINAQNVLINGETIGSRIKVGEFTPSGGTIDITGFVDGTDNWQIVLSNLEVDVANVEMRLRVSIDGGSSFAATSVYRGALRVARSDNTTDLITNGNPTTSIRLVPTGAAVAMATAAHGNRFNIVIPNARATDRRSYMHFEGSYSNTATAAMSCWGGGAYVNDNSAIDAVQISMASGNITNGKAVLYRLPDE